MVKAFKPEDFRLLKQWCLFDFADSIAAAANSLDAKRWACPEGGEHNPRRPKRLGLGPFSSQYGERRCGKCGTKLRARWEAYDRHPRLYAEPGKGGGEVKKKNGPRVIDPDTIDGGSGHLILAVCFFLAICFIFWVQT